MFAAKDIEMFSGKIGIHIHLHNPAHAQRFLSYISKFQYKFDLYITSLSTSAISEKFRSNAIPAAIMINIQQVADIGRDVAPWLIDIRKFQYKYDIFCHVHDKVSMNVNFSERWWKYLLDNLIQENAVHDIMSFFEEYDNLGCLFPPIFPELREYMNANRIPPMGLAREEEIAGQLLEIMGFDPYIHRHEIFFSPGNMFWYRPLALQRLIDLDVKRENFVSEVLLADAIERLPAIVAQRSGYMAKSYQREKP